MSVWLESGRRRYAEVIRTQGIASKSTGKRYVADFEDAKTSSVDLEPHEYNALVNPKRLWEASQHVGTVLNELSNSIAARMYEEYGDSCNYWDGGGLHGHNPFFGGPVVPFRENPVARIEQALLLRLMRAYITGLPSVLEGDTTLATQLSKELVAFVGDSS
jgi:hypothetical protein